MVQKYKIEKVTELKKRLDGAKAIVLVDYKGINIQEVDQLRKRMRENDVDYFVAKNTYVKIALNDLGITEFDSYLTGPTAVAVAKDEVAAARELAKFKKDITGDKPFPSFKIGLIDGSVLDAEQLAQLAKMPSREELLAQMLSCLNAPMANFVGVLSGIVRQFVGVVDAIAKKKAEQN